MVQVLRGPSELPPPVPGMIQISVQECSRRLLQDLGQQIIGGDSILTFTAAGTAPGGGGTGGEFVRNLHNHSTQSWDKWYHPGQNARQSWIKGQFRDTEIIIHKLVGYAICTANDCPCRDPVEWSLGLTTIATSITISASDNQMEDYASIVPSYESPFAPITDSDGTEWNIVHKVESGSAESLPEQRWCWKYFRFSHPIPASAVKLFITNNRAAESGIQLGHLHFYETAVASE